jgi:hypothetical protein
VLCSVPVLYDSASLRRDLGFPWKETYPRYAFSVLIVIRCKNKKSKIEVWTFKFKKCGFCNQWIQFYKKKARSVGLDIYIILFIIKHYGKKKPIKQLYFIYFYNIINFMVHYYVRWAIIVRAIWLLELHKDIY